MDRISRLPEPMLHHILFFLIEKEAVRTCVLSKSWRHVVSTRPNLEFRQSFFRLNEEKFMSFLDNTLLRYLNDQKLSIQDFLVEISSADSNLFLLLEKWIPLLLLKMGVKTFTLYNLRWRPISLPWSLFEAESLQKLVLHTCKLTRINPIDDEKILLKHLQTLSLTQVHITDEDFQNIMSSCPLIEHVTIRGCYGLRTIKVNKAAYNLKHFEFHHNMFRYGTDHSFEIHAPTVEHCPIWYEHRNYFPRLKFLYLSHVQLSEESLGSFSCNFPCLQVLSLYFCYGFEEFRLVSRSVKDLTLVGMWEKSKSIKLAINAPNILKFNYRSTIIPQSISFTTTSSEWKSNISLWQCPSEEFFHDTSSWLPKLHEMLKALSQSEISLDFTNCRSLNQDSYGDFGETVNVEHLRMKFYSSSSHSAIIDGLFCVCRPRNISQIWYKNESVEGIEFMWKVLVIERDRRDYFWQQDLEEVSMEFFDDNGEKWHPLLGGQV